MPPQIKQAKLETLEAIIKEVEGRETHTIDVGDLVECKKDLIDKDDLLTKLQAEKELIENEK